MKRTRALAPVALVLFCGVARPADARLVRAKSTPEVQFTAKGPAGLSIVGKTSDLSVRDDGKNLVVTVPLKNLTTGISMRDRHMKDKYLEVDKFPQAELKIPRSELKPVGSAKVSGELKGVVKIHGQAKAVGVRYTAAKKGEVIKVTGTLHINIKDYGIAVPSFLGVTVKPDIDVSVRFDAEDA